MGYLNGNVQKVTHRRSTIQGKMEYDVIRLQVAVNSWVAHRVS